MQAAVRYGTLVDAVAPRMSSRQAAVARDAVLVTAGAGLVAGCAQVSLPWHPVPLTGQTFAVLLVGGLLGAWRAGAALTLYWLAGVAGAPIYSDGDGGWSAFTAPSGGYILGFILAAVVVGYLSERGLDRRVVPMMGALLLGEALIYAVGVPWLAASSVAPGEGAFGWANAYEFGVQPFLLGDLVKLVAVAGLLPAGWALARALGIRGRDGEPRPGLT